MKKLTILIGSILSMTTLFGQINSNCSIDPLEYTGYVVSGQFAIMNFSDPQHNDVVMVRQVPQVFGNPSPLSISIDVLKGDAWGNRVLEKDVSSFPYDLSNVDGRMVAGDFDGDGNVDDFALLYKVSSSQMRVDVFKSNGNNFPSFSKYTFLTLNGYNADKITGRIVSGDFDRDGREDDIAMFYDYGGGETRIHVLKGMGTSFSYQGSTGFWASKGYTAGKVTDRVVSGDFNKDGKKDDIAAFYDYGGGKTRIHVWLSNGQSLSYQGGFGWWMSNGYNAPNITGRVASVNINRDSDAYDDIAVFYDYGDGETRMHVFESDGSGFNYSGSNGWWIGNGFEASKITGRVVAINSGFNLGSVGSNTTDVLAFYNHGSTTNKYHMWEANSSSGSSSVDYQQDNFCKTKSASKLKNDEQDEGAGISEIGLSVQTYPNPTLGELTIVFDGEKLEEVATIELYSVTGQLINTIETSEMQLNLDLSECKPGLFLMRVQTNSGVYTKQIIKE